MADDLDRERGTLTESRPERPLLELTPARRRQREQVLAIVRWLESLDRPDPQP